mmetsp:Transcript_46135/g.104576  ORF Transcript_46135/g.104576 Transcript_46135/m.104576 type:complete len:228 (-) Transcript_46135:1-684(-)
MSRTRQLGKDSRRVHHLPNLQLPHLPVLRISRLPSAQQSAVVLHSLVCPICVLQNPFPIIPPMTPQSFVQGSVTKSILTLSMRLAFHPLPDVSLAVCKLLVTFAVPNATFPLADVLELHFVDVRALSVLLSANPLSLILAFVGPNSSSMAVKDIVLKLSHVFVPSCGVDQSAIARPVEKSKLAFVISRRRCIKFLPGESELLPADVSKKTSQHGAGVPPIRQCRNRA